MEETKKNPFADSHGQPIFGKMHEFFNWQHEKELERRSNLPPKEQERLKQADEKFKKKMNS